MHFVGIAFETVAALLLFFPFAISSQGATNGGSEANANNMSGLEKSPRSQLSSPSQNYYSDDDFDLYPPRGKRLAPVGADFNEDETSMAYCSSGLPQPLSASDNNQLEERLRQMEEDQEELNSSLMSLTSHFAKVIFVYIDVRSLCRIVLVYFPKFPDVLQCKVIKKGTICFPAPLFKQSK